MAQLPGQPAAEGHGVGHLVAHAAFAGGKDDAAHPHAAKGSANFVFGHQVAAAVVVFKLEDGVGRLGDLGVNGVDEPGVGLGGDKFAVAAEEDEVGFGLLQAVGEGGKTAVVGHVERHQPFLDERR